MNKNIVVLGGGIAGIVSALLLKKKNNNVYLLEKNKKLGGLLGSRNLYKNLYFDYGCHFLKQTGIKLIDNIIFPNSKKKSFYRLGNLKGASFFKNYLDTYSPFLDLRKLPFNIYKKITKEILKKKFNKKNEKNLYGQIKNRYGNYILKHVFDPIINKKTFKTSLKKLPVDFHNFFGLGRFKAFTPDLARKIKKNFFFNNIFSFHSYIEGQSKLKSYYPKQGGSGKIIYFLEKALKKKNIKILKKINLQKINFSSGKIKSIIIGKNRELKCSKVIWSLNPNFLFNLIPFRYKLKNLKRKKFFLTLHHFVFKKKFLVNNHYIQCHDPSMITYRVTLYSNIRSKKFDKNKKNYHLTLEVISTNKKINLIKLEKKALNEVYKMGVIEEHQNPIYKFSEISANPIIPTIDIINEDIKKYNFLNKKISNIYFTSLPYYNFHTGSILKNIYKKFLKN